MSTTPNPKHTPLQLFLRIGHQRRRLPNTMPLLPKLHLNQPGQFYLRELQPLLAVIGKIMEPIDTYVIDGYCYLSPERTPGLGARLHNALGQTATIIGVAKNRYQQSEHAAEVLRRGSARPLFVTAIGIDYESAARLVGSMAGEFRIPTLIKAADSLSRVTKVRGSMPDAATLDSCSEQTKPSTTNP